MLIEDAIYGSSIKDLEDAISSEEEVTIDHIRMCLEMPGDDNQVYLNILRKLTENCANINGVVQCESAEEVVSSTPIKMAIAYGDLGAVQVLLECHAALEYGEDISNPIDDAMMFFENSEESKYAAESKYYQIIKLLIANDVVNVSVNPTFVLINLIEKREGPELCNKGMNILYRWSQDQQIHAGVQIASNLLGSSSASMGRVVDFLKGCEQGREILELIQGRDFEKLVKDLMPPWLKLKGIDPLVLDEAVINGNEERARFVFDEFRGNFGDNYSSKKSIEIWDSADFTEHYLANLFPGELAKSPVIRALEERLFSMAKGSCSAGPIEGIDPLILKVAEDVCLRVRGVLKQEITEEVVKVAVAAALAVSDKHFIIKAIDEHIPDSIEKNKERIGAFFAMSIRSEISHNNNFFAEMVPGLVSKLVADDILKGIQHYQVSPEQISLLSGVDRDSELIGKCVVPAIGCLKSSSSYADQQVTQELKGAYDRFKNKIDRAEKGRPNPQGIETQESSSLAYSYKGVTLQ